MVALEEVSIVRWASGNSAHVGGDAFIGISCTEASGRIFSYSALATSATGVSCKTRSHARAPRAETLLADLVPPPPGFTLLPNRLHRQGPCLIHHET